jgi:hypothetical protein
MDSVELEVVVTCVKCGASLVATCSWAHCGELEVDIDPCERCTQESFDEGYSEGYDEGYSEGLEEVE